MVFRVEKNKNYTVMSNQHFKNKNISLKAKGLLSQMLSLPEDWDYTIEGLALINMEGVGAIRTAILELEREGYIVREQDRSEGKFAKMIYVIREEPVNNDKVPDKNIINDFDSDEYGEDEANYEDLSDNETITEDQNKNKEEEKLCENSDTSYKTPSCKNCIAVEMQENTDFSPSCKNCITVEMQENTGFSPSCNYSITEKPMTENCRQLNTNILNTNILNKKRDVILGDFKTPMKGSSQKQKYETTTSREQSDQNAPVNTTWNVEMSQEKQTESKVPSRSDCIKFKDDCNLSHVDIDMFYDYYAAQNWKDNYGNHLNWKQKMILWHNREKKFILETNQKRAFGIKNCNFNNFEQREAEDIDELEKRLLGF